MNELEARILREFLHSPHHRFATGEIVEAVFSFEFQKPYTSFPDRKSRTNSQRIKMRLHRQALYHLNKLAMKNVLIHRNRIIPGEKSFQLNPKLIELYRLVQEKSVNLQCPVRALLPLLTVGN